MLLALLRWRSLRPRGPCVRPVVHDGGGKSQCRFDPKAKATRILEEDVARTVRVAVDFQSTLSTLCAEQCKQTELFDMVREKMEDRQDEEGYAKYWTREGTKINFSF
jgi:hypothetical protein